MKKARIFISIALFLAIVLSCMPISVIATEIEEIETPTEAENDTVVQEDTKISELVLAREESVKHFKLPDGTYEAVSYGQAVHRKDSDGVWQDINNDLTLTTVGTKEIYSTPDSRLSFDKGSNALTLSENGYSIYMSLLSQDDGNMSMTTEPMNIEVVNGYENRPEYYDALEEAIEVNNRSSITYSNVMNGTDIEYVMNGNDIKENIIVKTKKDSYEYGFMLALHGLVPTLENNVIILKDETTNEEKYIIPAPYMYDSNDMYSYDVEYGLIHAGGEKYLLTVTADAEWINDEERAWPVTIDPTIQNSNSNVYESYISSINPTANYGQSTHVMISNGTNNKCTALIKVTLPSIPAGTSSYIINSANLFVRCYSFRTSGSVTIGAFKINGSWSESTVTYNNAPSIDGTYMSTATMTLSSSTIDSNNPIRRGFSITSAVKSYYDTGTAFYGIALKHTSGSDDIIVRSYEANSSHAAYVSINYSYTDIESGLYAIKNAGLGTWVQIDDEDANDYSVSGADIEARPFTGGNHQLWQLTYLSNGYYKITSLESGLALTVKPGLMNTDTGSFVQEAYSTTDTKQWKITKSSAGNYIIRPKSAMLYTTDWCMYVGGTTSTTEKVRQAAYTNNSDYKDEWVLARIGYISAGEVEGQQESEWCWAATARMFAKHYYPTVTYTQSQAVTAVKGNIENETASLEETQKAVNYYISNISSAQIDTKAVESVVYSEETLLRFLDDGNVLIVARGKFIFENGLHTGTFGHACLAFGYVIIDSKYWLLIKDPLPEDQGSVYLMSYDKLYNGQNNRTEESPDDYVWYGSVVVNTSYVDNVIPFYYYNDV